VIEYSQLENNMTQRTFTGKTGDVWTWEETPETVEALKQLHNSVVNNRVNKPHPYKNEQGTTDA
jgi:hypothetical protein